MACCDADRSSISFASCWLASASAKEQVEVPEALRENGAGSEEVEAAESPRGETRASTASAAATRLPERRSVNSGTAELSRAASAKLEDIRLEELPDCPTIGCNYLFLQEFGESASQEVLAVFLQRPSENLASRSQGVTSSITASVRSEFAKFKESLQTQNVMRRVSRFRSSRRLASKQPSATPTSTPGAAQDTGSCSSASSINSSDAGDATPTPGPTGARVNMGLVCQELIKPRTRLLTQQSTSEYEFLSYAELGMRMGLTNKEGDPAFGPATHFVSHAWKYGFTSFVDAIGSWMEANNVAVKESYFWVDAFVVNQHQTQDYPQKWWSTRFMQAVGQMGNTVLVLEPWEDPLPLKRAWCIWEIYCTSVTGARLHFAMNPDSADRFKNALLDSFEGVQTCLSQVDVSKSEAFHERDQNMIHAEITRTVGFTKMNELVITRIQQWLIETAKRYVEELAGDNLFLSCRDEKGSPPRVLDENSRLYKYLRLKENLARMQREVGNLSDAEATLKELKKELAIHCGDTDPRTLSCLNQLAVTLQKNQHIAEALDMHRECLSRRREAFGQLHEDTLQSASNLAVLLSGSDPVSEASFVEAQSLYELAIRGREAKAGVNDPRTLYTVSNFGMLLSRAPKPTGDLLERAESLHARAVDCLKVVLHESHPLTLTAMHNQGHHWMIRAAFLKNAAMQDRAYDQMRDVLQLRTEKLGKEHLDTLATNNLMVRCSSDRLARGAALVSSSDTNWTELSLQTFPQMQTAEQFRQIRRLLVRFDYLRLRDELVKDGFVDPDNDELTVGMTPFNVFARLAAGVMVQTNMVEIQQRLGDFQNRFIVCCNRPECDDNWENGNSAWVGKASMSKRHVLLVCKDLYWEWFNVLTYGLVSGLDIGLRRLREMRDAALAFVRHSGSRMDGWPDVENVGLFLHVHAHSSVKSMHLHILDMNYVGPTYHKLKYKNLPLDSAIEVLQGELAVKKSSELSSSPVQESIMQTLPDDVPGEHPSSPALPGWFGGCCAAQQMH